MIVYLYNRYLKYKVNILTIKNCYFLETIPTIYANIITKHSQFLNINFLFYNIISFYVWVSFIIKNKLTILFVVEYKDINFLKLFINMNNLQIISEKTWIPGLLSNNNEIKQSNRYWSHSRSGSIQLKKYPNFLFLCSTQRSLICVEAINQLLPQFTILTSITNNLTNFFIPLFVPKWKKKKELNTKRDTIPYFWKQRYTIEKYLKITKQVNIKGYLVYFLFLNSLNIFRNIW